MATSGTPHEGRDNIIAPRVYDNLTLILYTNEGDSLNDTSVYADLVQPTGTGYAPIALSGVWSSTEGVVTYDHGTPDDPMFTNTDDTNNWSAPVVGAALIGGDGPYLLHFKDNPDGPITMTPGMRLRIDLSSLTAP